MNGNMIKNLLIIALVICLSAFQFNAPTYSISPDTNLHIKSLKINESVGVGDVRIPEDLNMNCRAFGPVGLPGKFTLATYIKKALEDELKVGGAFSSNNPKFILNGEVTKFDLSTMKGLIRGTYDITLKVTSSNGKSLEVNEYYEFDSGFDAMTACKNTSDALMPAVQNLVAKAFKSSQFPDLIKP